VTFVRAADAIGVILHIAEERRNLVDNRPVIADLELARRIWLLVRFAREGGEGEAEREGTRPTKCYADTWCPSSVTLKARPFKANPRRRSQVTAYHLC